MKNKPQKNNKKNAAEVHLNINVQYAKMDIHFDIW